MSTDATTRGVRSVRAHRARLWIVLGVLVIGATMLAVWPSARHVVPRITEWLRESGISKTSLIARPVMSAQCWWVFPSQWAGPRVSAPSWGRSWRWPALPRR
jgi:hypothetical protein